MVRSCIISFPDLTSLFYSKTSPPPLSPFKPQACHPTAIPYVSWQPPTYPRKCEGLCSHLPVGVETRLNGQLVSAPLIKKVLTPVTEEVDGRENVDTVAEPMNKMDEVGEANASGTVAGTLTTAVPAVFGVNSVDSERTPDLSSLFFVEGFEPVGQHVERLVKKRSAANRRLTTDWLATLSSLSDADLDHDDHASMLALYDAEIGDGKQLGIHVEPSHSPAFVPGRVLTAGATISQLSLPSVGIDGPGYVSVDHEDEAGKPDLQFAREHHPRTLKAPAAEDLDVWCEIALSPTVVEDVSKIPEPNMGKEDTEGEKAPPLSHVFFF